MYFMDLFNPETGIGLIVIVMIGFYLYKIGYRGTSHDNVKQTVDDYVEANGEPIDMIALDPTRCNEPDAVILVYEHDLVTNGITIPRNKVKSITFNNAAMPYVDNRYQIVLTTSLSDMPIIHLWVGADATYASEVLQQLNQYV